MNVRAQLAMVFHLDKCLGCHTCSIACKNVWTDRPGAEYMWWNNVETRPGTGFPARWEDQDTFAGGWEKRNGRLGLRSTSRARALPNIFHHPKMPTLDDYYEPWTYDYDALFSAPAGTDQPVARPISLLSGRPLVPDAGPNWDDDLGGSPIYAEDDPNLDALSPAEKQDLFALERLVFFYLPRTCNHCLNPACVAACPSGAIHKRGEDGVVLIDQNRCRGWRSCIAACPYKKTFYNWTAGKSEKCILCFPRIESGQAPACFHACPGRVRYLGVLLYDADRIPDAAGAGVGALVDAQRSMLLDPADPNVIAEAARCGIAEATIEAAQRSPVDRFVRQWKLAVPLHPEFRTLPMLFYVPPLSPAHGDGRESRIPLQLLANLFGAGDESAVRYALKKEEAVRTHRRAETVGDIAAVELEHMLAEGHCSSTEADAIYRLTTVATVSERFVVPPSFRAEAAGLLRGSGELR